ncbi:MAG: hypothetical protein IKF56_06445 [Eggerthellaceae bacterium]|nr:hypothetical protein [Eggerthellaceae bacterium]
MTRGFVTIATGSERYYIIASNLVASYRHFSSDPLSFAILCDVENEYTELFDDVVLLDNPYRSYLDKLALLDYAPYDETIFIDADCLAYRDLNDFWTYFENASDFTAFGTAFPADYPYAWFKREDVGDYSNRIEFVPDFIGGVYFIRKTPAIRAFSETCNHILENYYSYVFRIFEDPCDETIFALAMSVHGFKPIDKDLAPICFYPHRTYFKSNIVKGDVRYASKYEKELGMRSWAYMIHWGNRNTVRPPYTIEAARLKSLMRENGKLASTFNVLRVSAPYYAKSGIKRILSKLHLLDMAKRIRSAIKSSR